MYKMSEKPLITATQIAERLDTLAQEIKAFHPEIILSVLTGSYIFTADLSRRLSSPDLQIKFIKASSYGCSTKSSGKLEVSGLEGIDICGKRVLVIDDILDTGCTMESLAKILNGMGASLIKTCVLLNKESRRTVDFHADFVGFEIENEFVVGYGLDYANNYRTFPDIWTLRDENGK